MTHPPTPASPLPEGARDEGAAQMHCEDCDRPTICDLIKRGTAPCGKNAGMAPVACDLYDETETERRRLTAENARLTAANEYLVPELDRFAGLWKEACLIDRSLRDENARLSAVLDERTATAANVEAMLRDHLRDATARLGLVRRGIVNRDDNGYWHTTRYDVPFNRFNSFDEAATAALAARPTGDAK